MILALILVIAAVVYLVWALALVLTHTNRGHWFLGGLISLVFLASFAVLGILQTIRQKAAPVQYEQVREPLYRLKINHKHN